MALIWCRMVIHPSTDGVNMGLARVLPRAHIDEVYGFPGEPDGHLFIEGDVWQGEIDFLGVELVPGEKGLPACHLLVDICSHEPGHLGLAHDDRPFLLE